MIVPSVAGSERLERLLRSLDAQTLGHQTIVVDNGSRDRGVTRAAELFDGVDVIRLEENLGFGRAINLAAESAEGDAIVLVNDDCVCDPGFVAELAAALDPDAGVVMAAGVLRDGGDEALIDTAGVEFDRTLLAFDYLNGQPLAVLASGVPDPVGPCGGAAAYARAEFLRVGGFDERFFAYWEDIDLALRLRREGGRCVLVPGALGTHAHSATLGSGSSRKNYLMGFGRGYMLRKWGVLSPRTLPAILARDLLICAGQAVIDRNLAGVRGRINGYRAAPASGPYARGPLPAPATATARIRRRLARRARLARRSRAVSATDSELEPEWPRRSLVVLHLGDVSGPSRTLHAHLSSLVEGHEVTFVLPELGTAAPGLSTLGEVVVRDYEALTIPRTPAGAVRAARRLQAQRREFRALIRSRRPELVVISTALLPAVTAAAAREGVPSLVTASELLDDGSEGGALRAIAGWALARFTLTRADALAATSLAAARPYLRLGGAEVEVVYPPIAVPPSPPDAAEARRRFGIEPGAPCLAMVGAITERRGQDVLLRAVAELREARPGLRCLIAGAAHPRPVDLAFDRELERLTAELGLEDAIVRCGVVDPVDEVLVAADVVVNPRRFAEAFGRVAFEAALLGRPSVSSRVGGITEGLEDGESALLVPPGDHLALAEAIARLLDDPALGDRLSAAAADFARCHLDPGVNAARFARLAALARRGRS